MAWNVHARPKLAGTSTERGAKLGATARKSLGEGSFGASAWTFAGVEQAGLPGER